MAKRDTIVIAGYSNYSWQLLRILVERHDGPLYYVTKDRNIATEAGLLHGVTAVLGEITDTEILDEINLSRCSVFVAGSRDDECNILASLYAQRQDTKKVYARVHDKRLLPMLEAMGIHALQTSHIAAAFTAVQLQQPAVADLVHPVMGAFDLEEVAVADVPDLTGVELGHLQSEKLHIIAVAQNDGMELSYNTVIQADAKVIVILSHNIRKRLLPELRSVAKRARQYESHS